MKRFYAFFLSLWIVFLSVCPCMDGAEHQLVQGKASQSATITQEQSFGHHLDCCSEFCSCHCCQSVVFIAKTSVTILVEKVICSYFSTCSKLVSVILPNTFLPPRA